MTTIPTRSIVCCTRNAVPLPRSPAQTSCTCLLPNTSTSTVCLLSVC
ncbi:hypothetical protein E2C01_095638 [Portunus trituberculatus]|uniref:Uncharacterized protein n=1 Tax=Portunus trituberculatus TaxID=210409 RepID=A0A5B7JQC5_PORTR|nr:hypothetical protein [Portunus trituberculatus]